MKFKSTNRIVRALLARLLCLCHMSLSIFVLYNVKKDMIYLLPTIGTLLLLVETVIVIVIFKGKEPTRWLSTTFLIYVPTIVGCYWFLELENVCKMLKGSMVRNYKISRDDLTGDFVKSIKIIWAQVELQMFFALIMFVRWLIPKSTLTPHGLAELLFKYFAISCDMLDFLTITQDLTLSQNSLLVYWTLAVWSWSTIQFFIFVPKFDDPEKNDFTAYITNSLLSVIFLDLPYFGVRVAAIFAFGSHSYNSYFFATKNFVLIALQLYRIKATFLERDLRENKEAKQLKYRIGFDREASKLFDQNEIAKRNFFAQRNMNYLAQTATGMTSNNFVSMPNSLDDFGPSGVNNNETSNNINDLNNNRTQMSTSNRHNNRPLSPTPQNRIPRTIETVKNMSKMLNFEKPQNFENSIDCLSSGDEQLNEYSNCDDLDLSGFRPIQPPPTKITLNDFREILACNLPNNNLVLSAKVKAPYLSKKFTEV